MVDVVIVSDAVFQVNIIVNRSKNIFFRNMLRNQFMYIFLNRLCKQAGVFAVFFQNLL